MMAVFLRTPLRLMPRAHQPVEMQVLQMVSVESPSASGSENVLKGANIKSNALRTGSAHVIQRDVGKR